MAKCGSIALGSVLSPIATSAALAPTARTALAMRPSRHRIVPRDLPPMIPPLCRDAAVAHAIEPPRRKEHQGIIGIASVPSRGHHSEKSNGGLPCDIKG